MSRIGDLVSQLTSAQRQSREANRTRLRQLVGDLTDRGEQEPGGARGLLGEFGQSASDQLRRRTAQTGGSLEQDLISRGLGNSTILSSVRRGVERDRAEGQRDIDERVARQRADILAAVNQQGPDPGLVANLVRQAAAADTSPRVARIGAGGTGGFSGGGTGRSSGGTIGGIPVDEFNLPVDQGGSASPARPPQQVTRGGFTPFTTGGQVSAPSPGQRQITGSGGQIARATQQQSTQQDQQQQGPSSEIVGAARFLLNDRGPVSRNPTRSTSAAKTLRESGINPGDFNKLQQIVDSAKSNRGGGGTDDRTASAAAGRDLSGFPLGLAIAIREGRVT